MNKVQQKRYQSLYQQHLDALHRQGKSANTIELYARAVRRIAKHFDRCPDTLTLDDLKSYFVQLIKTHSWSTVKVDRNGLQFFYRHVLNIPWEWVDIVKPPQSKTLPDILTADEITRLINGTREARYQTYILTVYSMGLRLSEALALQIRDIDGQRMKVHVRQGKGGKDRFVTLPQATLLALRRYWATHRHPSLLFPAGKTVQERREATAPMPRGGVQQAFKAIAQSCRLHKSVSIHTLRHSYGAHLLELGVNLRVIQHELGHESPQTTALYTQFTASVQQNTAQAVNALVDRLTIVLDGEV
jgi:site-specific recombinase XerD